MNPSLTSIAAGAIALIALTVGSNAQAQTAINQQSALAGTNYGYLQDQPGFPVAIFMPGSYKLTGNLVVPAGMSGIEIYATGVTLDLNGFEIRTGHSCSRSEATGAMNCNSNAAIGNIGVDFRNTGNTLRNGRVSGFISGVKYKGADHLEDLLIENNVHGVRSDPYSGARTLIRSVRVQNNHESGFWAHSALVQGSSSVGNNIDGFSLGNSMVIESYAANNNRYGFHGQGGTTLAVGRNVATANDGGDFVGTRSMGGNINLNGVAY